MSNIARILCGRSLAKSQQANIIQTVNKIVNKGHRPPCITVILVGDNPASAIYVKAKQSACESVGIKSKVWHFAKTASQAELIDAVYQLNHDQEVDGVLIQLPLPNLDANALLSILDPSKDVDGLTPYNLGCLLSKNPKFIPCTPLGCMDLIHQTSPDISGKHAVVFGRSVLIGRPMALLLEQYGATVTVVHSKSRNIPEISRQADIVVAAIGQPELITADYIKPGAIVIDVGITRIGNSIVGDVHKSVGNIAGWLTPVPGGVGPMTITKLLSNTLKAAQNRIDHMCKASPVC